MRRSPFTAVALAAALALGVVACGSDNGEGSGATVTTTCTTLGPAAGGGGATDDTAVIDQAPPIAGGQVGGNPNTGLPGALDPRGDDVLGNSAGGGLPEPSVPDQNLDGAADFSQNDATYPCR